MWKRVTVEPASADDVRWAAALGGRVYEGLDAIPESVMLGWYGANPAGFSVLRRGLDERVGYVDLLPLRARALDGILSGEWLEREIAPSDLWTPEERASVTAVYLESVVARTDDLLPVPGGADAVLEAFPSLLERLCDARRLEGVYAIAASRNGERFLTRLGMRKIMDAAKRRDGHDLFALAVSRRTGIG